MKTLLRSMFIAAPGDDAGRFLQNYNEFRESGLTFDIPEDGVLWKFVRDFVQVHQHVPDVATIRDYYTLAMEDSIVQRLSTLAGLPSFSQGDFRLRLENRAKEQRSRKVADLLKEAATIHTTGLKVKRGKEEVTLQGPEAAVQYFVEGSDRLAAESKQAIATATSLADSLGWFDAELERRIAGDKRGVLTGLETLDRATDGLHAGELWIHAGYTGQLKSSLALTAMYNMAIHYRKSSLLVNLEMSRWQCARNLVSLHSHHPTFAPAKLRLGLVSASQPSFDELEEEECRQVIRQAGQVCLPTRALDLGTLTPAQQELAALVAQDLRTSPDYGRLNITSPGRDWTVAAIKAHAQECIRRDPRMRMVVVDHAGLLHSGSHSSDEYQQLATVARDLRQASLALEEGRCGILALWQVSRAGHQGATKARQEGHDYVYSDQALAKTHEAAQAADLVTAGFIDQELRDANRLLLNCLKSRDSEPFRPHVVEVAWDSRQLRDYHGIGSQPWNIPPAAKAAKAKANKDAGGPSAAEILDGLSDQL